jgi:hypothetical protein
MITSPINPMRYWKLEEIQSMLNKIEGYENVVIEFQYQQSDDWGKRKIWECRCGIKEQLVNGQYNWLLKYVFAIEANDEGDARTIAWQEAAERLVTDVWKNSIHSFRKQQRELNNFQQRTEFKTPPLTEEQTKNLITNIEKMNTNTQTKNITWTETNRWIASVGIVGGMLGLVYGLYTIGWLLHFGVGIFLTWLLTMVVFLVKHLIDELTDGR